jgi:hypothetical protein
MGTNADHIAQQAGGFEPQRQNNFSLEILGLTGNDKDLISLALSGISEIPGAENATIEIAYQNEKRYVAGPAVVGPFTLSLVDYVDMGVRDAVLRWRSQVYDPTTGNIGLAKNYKKLGNLILNAPDDSSYRVGQLIGIWPNTDPKGGLDMNSGEKVLMEIPIVVDKVIWAQGITASPP